MKALSTRIHEAIESWARELCDKHGLIWSDRPFENRRGIRFQMTTEILFFPQIEEQMCKRFEEAIELMRAQNCAPVLLAFAGIRQDIMIQHDILVELTIQSDVPIPIPMPEPNKIELD